MFEVKEKSIDDEEVKITIFQDSVILEVEDGKIEMTWEELAVVPVLIVKATKAAREIYHVV